MKIIIWAETISLIVLILFGLFGMIILSTFVHEMSHVKDLKGIAKNGAIIKIDGLPPNRSIWVPYGETVTKQITVERSPATFDFEDLSIAFVIYWY